MTGALKKQLKVMLDEILFFYLLILGGCLAGVIIMQILIRVDKSIDTYFPLGALIGAMMFLFYAFIVTITGFRQYFNMEISMGCTRKQFFFSYFTVSVLGNAVGGLLVRAFGHAEETVYPVLHPHMSMEYGASMLSYAIRYCIPAALVVTIFGIFFSAMMLRFGRKAFWVFWTLWMIGCIGGPRIYDAVSESPKSVLGMLGGALYQGFRSVPGTIWRMAVVILCMACLVISYVIVRKQQVE